MRIAFRVDSGHRMGSGHIMRCVTLAQALKEQGAEILFLTRPQRGDSVAVLEREHLPWQTLRSSAPPSGTLAHRDWLGTTQTLDAQECLTLLGDDPWDLIVVDHYALDRAWESQLHGTCQQVMVIDDLADREHKSAILLDQNLGRTPADYSGLVADEAALLTGVNFSLLKPIYARARKSVMTRRELRRLLVSMGGVDPDNVTATVLEALASTTLTNRIQVTVVLGAGYAYQAELEDLLGRLQLDVSVVRNVTNMHEYMVVADLAIGGAGTTSWERCCLGLPTVAIELADNQKTAIRGLAETGAAIAMQRHQIATELPQVVTVLANEPKRLEQMSQAALSLVDGQGLARVVDVIMARLATGQEIAK
ncbi:MAG: UDP-2,4-diacetamido-2,4,6-trideoxy-beta-L-altropyranose hydrolase [Idiomarina sp.]|nr:UDP-2,4-diacetamido-2,4,6-trideoxy-beta-L-altropyranose hydrolase [Idiomarina sp.]